MRFGPWELGVVLLIVMLIFGASRLPQIGSSLGRSLRAFKTAVTGQDEADDEEAKDKKVGSAVKDREKS